MSKMRSLISDSLAFSVECKYTIIHRDDYIQCSETKYILSANGTNMLFLSKIIKVGQKRDPHGSKGKFSVKHTLFSKEIIQGIILATAIYQQDNANETIVISAMMMLILLKTVSTTT